MASKLTALICNAYLIARCSTYSHLPALPSRVSNNRSVRLRVPSGMILATRQRSLSSRTERGTAPKKTEARTCPSSQASTFAAGYARLCVAVCVAEYCSAVHSSSPCCPTASNDCREHNPSTAARRIIGVLGNFFGAYLCSGRKNGILGFLEFKHEQNMDDCHPRSFGDIHASSCRYGPDAFL